MNSYKKLNNIAGWLVFAIAAMVLGAAAEPTGSLWDCGEFISGAYKLQVVHPPGAPIFLLVGRLFALVGKMVSAKPEGIAYAVNLMSALCTAFGAMFICWSATILSKLALVGRDEEPTQGQSIAILGTGVVAGLTAAFCSSVWFSAVEGEVYSMSLFFTCMTMWAMLKWYNLPDTAESDRWIVFAVYSTALSIGVHLLSLLTFPALAMLYYFKKVQKVTILGTLISAIVGVLFIVVMQSVVITGIPNLWAFLDLHMVNDFGMPFNASLVPLALLFGGAIWFGLSRAARTGNGNLQKIVVALTVTVIAYMSYGMVVIRANANPPINMNNPTDAIRLLPYLNREQYGERPLVRGPHFDAKPVDMVIEDRYGRVGNEYKIVDQKIDYAYAAKDKSLFPRLGDWSQGRPQLYRRWINKESGGTPTFGDNLSFFFRYQIGWMYWRYFMWNFSGRQNGDQGYYDWDPSSGNWRSGFDFYDAARLGNQSQLTDWMKNNPARNAYYMIPFFLGLLGLFFHYSRRPREFAALMALFIITGIGIIVYSNQPPNEPRERDYVLAGSFVIYSIWVGMGVLALFDLLSNKLKLGENAAAPAAILIGLSAPFLMGTQNWDDHSRAKHYGSRDYASNFLNSCEENAIIFTYGDNDTYPLWYCQEVEGIRTDVRVVNLSLIAVDWYIDQLRRKINNSPAIKMGIPAEQYRGFRRQQTPFYAPNGEKEMTLEQMLKFVGEDHPIPTQGGRPFDSYLPSRKLVIPVDKQAALKSGVVSLKDSAAIVDTIRFNLGNEQNLLKDDLAMLDIIRSNIWDRPIYWAVTTREEKLLGLADYMQLEGMSLRLIPVKSASDTRNYNLIGSGRCAADIAYKNIMEKWKWGNFDKEKLFVDRSFLPSLQTMRVAMIRIARTLLQQGEKEKCISLVDKYFEVFPSYNFQLDHFTNYLLTIYVQAGAYDKAKPHIRELAKEMEQQLKFYDSLSPDDLKAGYQTDMAIALRTKDDLIRLAQEMKDDALKTELQTQFANWKEQGDLKD